VVEPSPRSLARKAGICQLLAAITATFGEVIVPGKLLVSGNAAATAANILGHGQLFWWGFASSVAGVLLHAAWALLLYDLFKVVNRRVMSLAVFVMLVGCSIQALASCLYLAPYVVLRSGPSLSAFTAEQLNALALLFAKLSIYAIYVFSAFFGVWLVLIAFLIFKSTFLPRLLGVLVAVAGFAWMIYLVPPVAVRLFPLIAAASAIGEVPLELWLIVKAVDEKKWKQQALAATSSAIT
jgi:hypothetical protein